MLLLVVILLLAVGFLAYASCRIGTGFYLKCLCRNPKAGRRVALTFDDGVDPLRTPRVLEVLARHEIRATFFLIGERAEQHPELVKRLVAEGHLIGNHSYFHRGVLPPRYTAARRPWSELRVRKFAIFVRRSG